MTNGLRLRKMDVSPPTFDGLIDGIKLNSFIFQFESYFQQKGYNLTQHDHLLPHELNQCVCKNALVWYERYMTDDMTTKLWSIMKGEMVREFREPNFQAKMRIAIQRKQPMTLTAAVQEGFLEWELQDNQLQLQKVKLIHGVQPTNQMVDTRNVDLGKLFSTAIRVVLVPLLLLHRKNLPANIAGAGFTAKMTAALSILRKSHRVYSKNNNSLRVVGNARF
ncbi:hypothetical protein PHMEG_00038438 [Phytophthora megakarya]|uniref:Retrotransposon gag domain-containing protein n=1 Tax=Phytophthora megakarya TaxID=4795 RepID=A0A225UHJ0_9STRA|nr:hypothetical protein PHMEG_00038438 [Phytophthora megakarya]